MFQWRSTTVEIHFRWGAGDEDQDEADAQEGDPKSSRKEKCPNKKKKKHAKKASKGTSRGQAEAKSVSPEKMEEGGAAAKNKKQKPASSSQDCAYIAGEYKTQRVNFINKKRGKGFTYKEASNLWNTSSIREKLLEGMSHSEKVRRRFV